MEKVKNPQRGQTLDEYLVDHGIEHFSASELLRMRRAGITVPTPKKAMWHRMIPTLRLAEMLRTALGHGLIVGNGYRPEPFNSRVGGAKSMRGKQGLTGVGGTKVANEDDLGPAIRRAYAEARGTR